MLFAEGSHLWRELVLRRYDPPWNAGAEGVDWKLIYPTRVWVEGVVSGAQPHPALLEPVGLDAPAWKVSQMALAKVIRDMLVENGIQFSDDPANLKIRETNVISRRLQNLHMFSEELKTTRTCPRA
jgi:hypothetical protein